MTRKIFILFLLCAFAMPLPAAEARFAPAGNATADGVYSGGVRVGHARRHHKRCCRHVSSGKRYISR